MSKELELYKAFIDGLVERKDSMTALWVKGDGFPKTEDNKAKNELLAALTPEQKGVLAEMLQDEHIAGIHDTLAYINEMMDLEGLELHQDGESYPNDYFESLHYDFISGISRKHRSILCRWQPLHRTDRRPDRNNSRRVLPLPLPGFRQDAF